MGVLEQVQIEPLYRRIHIHIHVHVYTLLPSICTYITVYVFKIT